MASFSTPRPTSTRTNPALPTSTSTDPLTTITTLPTIPTTSTSSTTSTTSTSLSTSTSRSTTSTSITPSTATSATTSSTTSSSLTSAPLTIPPFSTTSLPAVSTSTFVVSAPSITSQPTQSAASRAASNGFFSNKGEVAGVFTVVGLLAIAVLFTAVTTVIRRRRAKQFDKDVAEAAMQAAATSHSANFDDFGYGGNDNPYNGYSAESHGTYGQPAMSHGVHPAESYVMNDVGGGAGYDQYDGYGGVAAGAAGIGAASPMQRARSRRQISGSHSGPAVGAGGQPGDYGPGYEERTPYAAFAGPGVQPHEVYDQQGVPGLRYRHAPGGQEPDLLEAAGLGVSAAGAGAAGAAYMNRQPSEQRPHADLSRSKSKGGFGSVSDGQGYSSSSPPPPGESYAAHYQPGYHPDPSQSQSQQLPPSYAGGRPSGGFSDGHDRDINRLSADPFASHHTMPSPPASTSHAQYDAYADDAMGPGPGSDEAGGHFIGDTGRSEEGARMSFQDEEDYGRQPRVLKVTNE